MMRKIFLVLLVFISVGLFGADRSKTLKVYNWADYISPEVLDSFPSWYERQTGETVEILYNTFDVNENMLTQIEMGHEDYDVICPSEYIIDRMLRLGLLQKIPFDILPDSICYVSDVAPFAVDKFRQMSGVVDVTDYAVGYMWGTTGWLYNSDLVDSASVSSWSAIENTKFVNNIYMKDAYRDIYSVIVLYAYRDSGIDKDSLVQGIKSEYVDSVGSLLMRCKSQFRGFEVDFGKEEMVKGGAMLNLSWSGDAQWAIDEASLSGVHLEYVVPREGSNVWFDGWCIPIYAVNTKAAVYFIDYLCRADNAIKNMEEIGYVSVIASPAILEWAQDDSYPSCDASYFFGETYSSVHLNPVMYPDKSVIDRCALMKDCGDMNTPLLNMWNSVKSNNVGVVYVIFLGSVFLFAVLFAIYKAHKHRQEQQLNKKSKKKKKRS